MRTRELSIVTFLILFLLPVFAQGFDIDRNLGANEFYAAYRDASTGWRIEGSFTASNDVEFFICDEANYTGWKRQESVVLFEHSEVTTGQTFNFTIPHDSIWYVVILNVHQGGISLEADLYFIDQADIAQTQVTWIIESTVVTPLFIVFLLAVPIVCILGIWISRRGESFPAVRYEKILPKPD